MQSLNDHANTTLKSLDAASLRRVLEPTERHSDEGPVVYRHERRMISFSCNDYLNMANDPRVIDAAVAATRRYGTGAGASRLVTGDHPLYAQLERRLASLKGSEDACVFGSGYLANTGIIPALVTRGNLILVDALAHSCIWAGAVLSGARVRRFRHNDLAHLAELLSIGRQEVRHALIATERVFSMDGDLAPLGELVTLALAHDAWLMTDDAHGFGVLPHVTGDVPLQVGTLSKAVGSYGGYVCASSAVVDLIRNTARTLVYTTGLPPGAVAAALAALEIIAAEPGYVARPLAHARLFAQATGLAQPQSAIIPIILGDAARTLEAAAQLSEEGFFVGAIRPPTVPTGTARLRLTFTARHTEHDILRLASLVRNLLV